MVSRTIQVCNEEGIHLRPAGIVCEAAYRFQSKILFLYDGKRINAKSVLNVLSAGILPGDSIEIVCEGEDERLALDALCKVIREL